MTAIAQPPTARRVMALRGNALGGLILILVEYSLGIAANLYAKLPAADHGKTLFAGLVAAVGHGPVIVSVHAVLGTLLLGTGAAALVRAVRLRRRPLIVLSGGALLATVVAWVSGSEFIGHQRNGASLSMALAAAVAMLCYSLLVFVLGGGHRGPRESRTGAEVVPPGREARRQPAATPRG